MEKICELFEEATKKQNKSEELFSHLFMAYVRVGNYKKQQQTAMALYKLKPKNPYYFWAVISIVMQAREQPAGSNSRAVCLTLAERMVERFFREGKLEAEAEVLAYLYILELQNKFEEALDILETDLRDKITQQPANFVQLKRLHYHTSLQRWGRAHAIAKELIEQERDNWQHYESFCASLLKLHEEANPGITANEGADSISLGVLCEGVSWLRGVLATSEEQHGTKYRAPYLALLQLAWELDRAALRRLLPKLEVRVEEEMLGYLTRFGNKWCAFSDVRRFFVLVPEEAAAGLLQQLRALVTLGPDGVPTDVHMLHRHLTWLQVSRCLQQSPETSAEEHLVTADQLLQLYNNTQHLASLTTQTDIRRNDIYLLLSGHSVLHALTALSRTSSVTTISSQCTPGDGSATSNGGLQTAQERSSLECNRVQASDSPKTPAKGLFSSQLLVKLAGLLEAAVASSKANFQLKLLLLQVYNMIGACGSGRGCYESLEVKSVQLDTLGHVAALQALDAAHYSAAAAVFQATNSFFVAAAKDTCEPMMQAYKYGTLTRIPEFGEFRERLERSVHFATVTAEQMLLELTHTVSNHKVALMQLDQQAIDPDKDRTDYDTLVDNADHSVKIAWHCVYSSAASSQSETAPEATAAPSPSSSSSSDGPSVPCVGVVEMLKFRHATLRLLGAAFRCNNISATSGKGVAAQNKSSAASVALTNGGSAADITSPLSQLDGMLQELDQLQQQALQSQGVSSNTSLNCTSLGCHRWLTGYRSGGYITCILQHGRLLHHLLLCSPTHASTAGNTSAYDSSHLKACQSSLSSLLASASQQLRALHCTSATASITNTAALHVLHHTVQTVGVVAILLGFSSAAVRSSTSKRATNAKKNKKKKEALPQAESAVALTGHLKWLESELEGHHSALRTKLDTAKLNSRNNCALSYPRLTPVFSDSTTHMSSVDIAGLSLDERLSNGSLTHETTNVTSHGDRLDETIKFVSERSQKKATKLTSESVKEEPSSEDALEPVQPDFVKTSLMIDASYQESLANLTTALAAKLKYISSL